MNTIKIAFKNSSLVFEATGSEDGSWTIKSPEEKTCDFLAMTIFFADLVKTRLQDLTAHISSGAYVNLSTLSFSRKFASTEFTPFALKEQFLSDVFLTLACSSGEINA